MQRAEVIDAVCAWGWDRESHASPERAEAALAALGSVGNVRDDFVLACITGEVEAVRAALAREPALATAPSPPRDWPPLLYTCFSVLGRAGGPRAARIVEVAELLLAHGADGNSHYRHRDPSDDCKFPALYAAIAVTDNLDLAAALLAGGASPSDGQSLYHAAERFSTDALDLLYRFQLDRDELSYCLLHQIDFQYEPGIRWLLAHGADPDARHPQSGESALHWAIKRASSRDVVALLIAHGAEVNARVRAEHSLYPEIRGATPIDLARRLARADLVALLGAHGGHASPILDDDAFVFAILEGTPPPAAGALARLSAIDRALLTHVAHQNETAAAIRLIEAGWPLDSRGWMAATPLHWAACRGNATLARALLAHGAPMIDVGGYFQTPLHTALHCRWPREPADPAGVLDALVAAGAALPATRPTTGHAALDAALDRLYAAR
ncbi:MAG TPA: ankyrin repeat domain-containing protein [Kofleriaceae bacterium]|nr:ankyrin repeat domain-containing protein [Kofleriaceae bacterium]